MEHTEPPLNDPDPPKPSCMSKIMDSGTFRFMDLTPELRDEVYSHLWEVKIARLEIIREQPPLQTGTCRYAFDKKYRSISKKSPKNSRQ